MGGLGAGGLNSWHFLMKEVVTYRGTPRSPKKPRGPCLTKQRDFHIQPLDRVHGKILYPSVPHLLAGKSHPPKKNNVPRRNKTMSIPFLLGRLPSCLYDIYFTFINIYLPLTHHPSWIWVVLSLGFSSIGAPLIGAHFASTKDYSIPYGNNESFDGLRFAWKWCLEKVPQNLLPNGDFSWRWLTMVESVKHHLKQMKSKYISLVGGFNPSENISQIGWFSQVGVKIKQCLKPPPREFIPWHMSRFCKWLNFSPWSFAKATATAAP